ncbi:MAG: type II secretion system protein [Gallionella sp.]|nr:type II secretion system protein [Gallionella sp.]
MLERLAQSEQMREFFIQMWQQNPLLAKQGGARVASLLSPLEVSAPTEAIEPNERFGFKQQGISLIELIMFIVIVGVALTGVVLVMNQTSRASVDPLVRKQALAAAYSLLEEIQLQDFVSASGVTNKVTQANRASEYHIVSDYQDFSTTGVFALSGGAATAGLERYNASVAVTPEAAVWNDIPAGSAVQITVTVTTPGGEAIVASGYRTAY